MAKKLYFKIGEACKELDIQPYVLRYWETEFPALSPDKSKSGQRVYSRQDLGIIRRIKGKAAKAGAKPASEPQPKTAAKAKAAKEPELDSGAADAKMLREGIQDALKEVQAILAILDSKSPTD